MLANLGECLRALSKRVEGFHRLQRHVRPHRQTRSGGKVSPELRVEGRSARSAEQRCGGKHCVACLVNHRFVGDLLESILFDRKLNHPGNVLCAITCAVERG